MFSLLNAWQVLPLIWQAIDVRNLTNYEMSVAKNYCRSATAQNGSLDCLALVECCYACQGLRFL